MPGVSDHDLISLWSTAQAVHPVARAVALLRFASPDTSFDDLARLPIGARDTRLFSLREDWFGPSLTATTNCPACGTRVELDIPVSALTSNDTPAADRGVRPINTHDLLAIAAEPDEERATRILMERCAAADSQALADADPAADVTIALTCPECTHTWENSLDIAAFLWKEIEVAALRALRDVHVLAGAYGWTEDQILAIPPQRRQSYLAMVTA